MVALLIAALSIACAPDVDAERSATLRRARELYVAGDYEGARDLFTGVGLHDQQPAAATLGAARSNQALQAYGEAIDGYRRALQQRPDDALAWAGYLETLYQDGSARGDGARLETVLELAPVALTTAPSRVEIYDTVLRAAAELDRPDEYPVLLEVVAEALPAHPVVTVELARARINAARRAANGTPGASEAAAASGHTHSPPATGPSASREDAAVTATRLREREAELRLWLEQIAAAADEQPSSTIGERHEVDYALAVGYELLGEPDRVETALRRLERDDEGREMAAPRRYREFLDAWTRSMNDAPAARLALADSWLQRFVSRWSNDGVRYRAVLGMQFDVLVAAMRAELSSPGTVPSEPQAERLAGIGRRLFRIDMGQRVARAVQTAGVLALVPSQYATAARVAADGAEALRADAPGLLDAALREPERDEIRRRYLSLLLQIRGQALHNLARADAAESALREAIEAFPAAQSHAVLGGLLLDQGRTAEAYDMLVRALAVGFDSGQEAVQEQTRASALEAAAAIGEPAEELDAAITRAAERVAEERAAAIVADPLDIAAPDFALADLDGAEWRLSELLGRVVVINFWATWCGPCIAEMPHYQGLVDAYADAEEVVFLAISTDSDVAAVPRFMERGGYDFTVLLDQDAAGDFDISGVPATFIVGRDGMIKYRTSGFPGAERYLRYMRLRIEALR